MLEHLRNLPPCRRVLKPGGEFVVGLPAEGGILYYRRLLSAEHYNTCREVLEELRAHFDVVQRRYLPFGLPSVHLSAVVVARALRAGT